ncbi:MAG: hypothetical protein ACI9JN_000897 [Bacteroidia bacterium]|jgi:hypothetical protein
MKRLIFITLLILGAGTIPICFGQAEFLPVQQNAHWGYINCTGTFVIPAKFDLAHKFEDGVAKVELNGKSYLINQDGARISPNGINEFNRLGSFIVYRKDLFLGMCKYDGTKILDPIYSTIESTIRSDHFIVSKSNRFGIMDTTGIQVVPDKYEKIQLYAGNYWCANMDGKTFSFYIPLLDLYLEGAYTDVQHIGYYVFTKAGNKWFIQGEANASQPKGWKEILTINSGYFIGINGKDTTLYSAKTLNDIATNFGFVDQKESGRLVISKNDLKQIVTGDYLDSETYAVLKLYPNKLYYVIQQGYANYLDSTLKPMYAWKYKAIQPIDSALAKVFTNDGIGIIDIHSKKEILAPKYSSLNLYNHTIKAYTSSNTLWLFQLEDNKLKDSMSFTNVRTVNSFDMSISRNANIANKQDTGITKKGRWFLRNGLWGFVSRTGSELIRPTYSSIEQLNGCRFTIVKRQIINPRTGKLVKSYLGVVDEVKGSQLIHTQCTYIDEEMLLDPSFQIVRVRLNTGVFDVIDKNSGYKKRMNSAFIGDFVNGRARIYIGGHLSYIEPPSLPNIGLAWKFTTKYGYSIGRSYNRYLNYVQSRYKSKAVSVSAVKGQWNFIDRQGNLLLPIYKMQTNKITYATPFDSTNAVVYRSDTCALMDRKGTFLTRFAYTSIQKISGDSSHYFKVSKRSASYNYYNQKGQKIGNVFEYGSDLNHGAAWVVQNDTFVILRDDGTTRNTTVEGIPYRHRFNSGFSPMEVDRKWTLVDTSGSLLFKPTLGKIIWSSEGLSAQRMVISKRGKNRTSGYGIINTDGDIITDQLFSRAYPFSNGFAAVRIGRSRLGFIDSTGEIIRKNSFDKMWSFDQNGLCIVRKGGKGVVNSIGKTVVPTRYSKVYIGDTAILAGLGSKFVVYHSSGKRLKTFLHVQRMRPYSDGLAMIRKKNKVGYVDEYGKFQIKLQYTEGTAFSDGAALVKTRKGQYVIDKDKTVLSTYPFRDRLLYSEGFVLRRTASGFRFFNRYGVPISNTSYDLAKPFKDGYAQVRKDGKWGLINKQGEHVLPCEYSVIRINALGEISANKSLSYGLIDTKGNEVVSATYDQLDFDQKLNVYHLRYGYIPSYMAPDGSWIWRQRLLAGE